MRDHVRRVLGLVVLVGLLLVSLTGCLRVHAALAVSQDDLISGKLVVATLRAAKDDDGPSLTVPPELADKVHLEPYAADGYVGQKITLTDLRFADLAMLVDSISPTQHYRLSFHRAGSLVTLAGSVDLTRVPEERADVQVKIALPGRVSRTNGQNADGTITWSPKPGSVTEFRATAKYSNSAGGISWTQWVAIVGGGAIGVALLVVLLALFARRRSLRLERAQAR